MSEKDYPNERDCEHGHLRRSCPTCAADSDYAALEEIASEQSATILRLHEKYEQLLARHNALREAVAWERECCQDIRPLVAWADLYVRHGEDYVDGVAEDLRAIQDAARSEVDRLLNEGAADCEGEG